MDLLVNIDVDDLARGIAFYTSAFDLTPARRFGGMGVELGGPAPRIYRLTKKEGSVATAGGARRTFQRHWTPVHIDFVVSDVDGAVAKAVAAGAALGAGAGDAAGGAV